MKIEVIQLVLKIKCPECGHWNFVNKGDIFEFSVEKDFAVRCWFCESGSWFTEDEQNLNEEDLWFQPGAKRP